MLSIHDTSEIVLENILLEKNKVYDDTLHFVYGNNIKINNCYINNAFADAIDIDISKISIDPVELNIKTKGFFSSIGSTIQHFFRVARTFLEQIENIEAE